MTQPLTDEQWKKLCFYMKEDVNAVKLSLDMFYLCHLWDDLIDRDVERSNDDINQGFRMCFVDIPLNPLYQAWAPQLSGLMAAAALQYIDSTVLEKDPNEDAKLNAFSMRNILLSVLHFCMFAVGGAMWVKEQGPDFWRDFGLTNLKWQEFLAEGTAA